MSLYIINNLIKIKKSTYRVNVVCSIEIVTGADNLASSQAFIRSKSASDTVDVVIDNHHIATRFRLF